MNLNLSHLVTQFDARVKSKNASVMSIEINKTDEHNRQQDKLNNFSATQLNLDAKLILQFKFL